MKPGGNRNFATAVLRRNPAVAFAESCARSYLKNESKDIYRFLTGHSLAATLTRPLPTFQAAVGHRFD